MSRITSSVINKRWAPLVVVQRCFSPCLYMWKMGQGALESKICSYSHVLMKHIACHTEIILFGKPNRLDGYDSVVCCLDFYCHSSAGTLVWFLTNKSSVVKTNFYQMKLLSQVKVYLPLQDFESSMLLLHPSWIIATHYVLVLISHHCSGYRPFRIQQLIS